MWWVPMWVVVTVVGVCGVVASANAVRFERRVAREVREMQRGTEAASLDRGLAGLPTATTATNVPRNRLRQSRFSRSARSAVCLRVTSARFGSRLALFNSSICWAIARTASRRGSTSRRRNAALWLTFSTVVQSMIGSKPRQ
jgi:hypothetical protein